MPRGIDLIENILMSPYFKVYVHTFLSSIYVNFLLKSEVDGFEEKISKWKVSQKLYLDYS